MPAQQVKSVLAKYGDRIKAAVNKARENPVDYGFSGRGLPPGIRGAICELSECGFKVYDKGTMAGEAYYYEVGVIKFPKSFTDDKGNIHNLFGLHTRGLDHMVSCCEVKNADGTVRFTFQQQWDEICNRIRMLGGEDCIPPNADGPTVEAIAAQVQAAHPRFRLSTSLGKPQIDQTPGPNKGKPKLDPATGKPYEPKVWENWSKQPGDPLTFTEDDGTQDDSGAPHTNGQQQTAASQEQSGPVDSVEVQQPDAAGGADDLDQLAAEANSGSQEAVDKLKALGRACGFDVEDLDASGKPNDPPKDPFVAAADWTEAVALIRSGGPAAAQAEEPTAPPAPAKAPPKKGDRVKYRITNAQTGKPGEPVECEVVNFDPKAGTVGLQNAATRKFVLGPDKKILQVPVASLE